MSKVLFSILSLGFIGGGVVAGSIKLFGEKKENFKKSKVEKTIIKKDLVVHNSNHKEESEDSSKNNLESDFKVEEIFPPKTNIEEEIDSKMESKGEEKEEVKLDELKIISQESKAEKYEKERKEQDILLESIWMYRFADLNKSQKYCFLMKKEDLKKEIPNIMMQDDDEDSCDNIETSWYLDKSLSSEHEDSFWLRGQDKEVKKFIDLNWEELLLKSRFAKNKEKPLSLKEQIEQLKDICSIIDKDNWKEISCMNKRIKNL